MTNLTAGDCLQVIRDRVNMPVVMVGGTRLDYFPGQANEVPKMPSSFLRLNQRRQSLP